MVRIVDEITFDTRIRRERFLLINQHRVIEAQLGIRRKKNNEYFAARQSGVQPVVGSLLVCRALLEDHPHVANAKVAWPAMADACLHGFATSFAQLPQVLISGKN